MRCLKLTLLFLSVCEITQVLCRQDFVKVSLYYESFCPFCREFVTEQLYPGYERIKNYLIVDLVPYGKANQTKIDGNWKFECQHGPKECLGNKIQVCVLAKTFLLRDKVGFVNCMMGSQDPGSTQNAKTCASVNNIAWTDIRECIAGVQGNNFLAHYGDITKNLHPKLTYIPHIVFNGIFNETLEDEARDNFLKTVCTLFITKPVACNETIDNK